MKATIHPWDIDQIQPGWAMTTQQIEEVTGCKYGTQEYQLALLGLTARLRNELQMRDGKLYCVRNPRGGIRVLHDSEAVSASRGKSDAGVRKVVMAEHEMRGIDASKLSAEELDAYRRNRITSGNRVIALRKAQTVSLRINVNGNRSQLKRKP